VRQLVICPVPWALPAAPSVPQDSCQTQGLEYLSSIQISKKKKKKKKSQTLDVSNETLEMLKFVFKHAVIKNRPEVPS
jgi:hypothetical protein